MSLLTINNLSAGYGGKSIIENLSFKVESGDYLCIVGENGSGKSTLVKTILNLQPVLSGQIILGDDLKHNEIGYLPQQTDAQKDFPASVYEVVLSGLQNKCGFKPFYSKAQKQFALSVMQKLDILHLKKKCYRELSGGGQQKVLLCRALCATSKLLFLDEPTNTLDVNASKDLYETIKGLNESGTTIIMISHDIEGVVKYASKVLHIGKKCFFGTKSEYLQSAMYNEFVKRSSV